MEAAGFLASKLAPGVPFADGRGTAPRLPPCPEPHLRVPSGILQKRCDLTDALHGQLFAAGSILEEDQGGEGFAMDVLGFEDGQHVLREAADFGSAALAQVQESQVERDHRGVIADPLGDETVPGLAVGLFRRRGLPSRFGEVAPQPGEAPSRMTYPSPVALTSFKVEAYPF